MSIDRPHEDRLGTGGASVGQALTRTGTGIAAWGPAGFSPVVGYAELNGNAPTDATPNVQTAVDFDTFYDVDFNAGALPAGLSLTYAAGVFTATEDGIWILNLGVEVTAAPGTSGRIRLLVPNFGYLPTLKVLASGNPNPWEVERTAVMHSGDTFSVVQDNTGSSVDQIDGYAEMDIIRIAGTVS